MFSGHYCALLIGCCNYRVVTLVADKLEGNCIRQPAKATGLASFPGHCPAIRRLQEEPGYNWPRSSH